MIVLVHSLKLIPTLEVSQEFWHSVIMIFLTTSKHVFLYFGMFLEDCAINCARLTRLWIAKGFVKEKKGHTLEDVAQDYLNQLIHRNLVQVDGEDFVGRI